MTDADSVEAKAPKPHRGLPALEWWQRLSHPRHGNRGALARLRRSRSSLEAMQVPEAIELASRSGALVEGRQVPDWKVRAALDLGRVLAHVREHDPVRHPMRAAGWKHFAGTRRETDAGTDRPVLSEARFRRLVLTGDGEEKVAAFSRLIALLGGTVKVDDLACDFMSWNHPDHGDRVRERWAFIYYAAGSAAPPLPVETNPDIEDET